MKNEKNNWCEGGLKLSDIATRNVGDNYLNPRMKHIMVGLTTDREHLYKRGDRIEDSLWNKTSIGLD